MFPLNKNFTRDLLIENEILKICNESEIFIE
jgi:hypothetical protein